MKKALYIIIAVAFASCTSTKKMDTAGSSGKGNTSTLDKAMASLVTEDSKPDRSKVPTPGPAPEIQIGKYESFTLENGLKVFVVENDKLPMVSFSLIIDRDQILEGEKAGYVATAGDLLSRGTKSKTKEQIDEEVDFIGASLSTSSSGVFGSSLSKHKEKLLAIMADVTLNPSFPPEELDKIKKQTISGLQSQKEDPNAIAENVRLVLRYGKNHPYGELVTEESVNNISLDDCKNYYNTYFKPNITYMAIVGDITKREAETLIKKYFGGWQKGEVPTHSYEMPTSPETPIVALVDRPQAVQSIINITYPVSLKPGEDDVIKARLMDNILGGGFSGRLFANLRETHGYTYGAYSSLSSDELIGSFNATASVRNEVTDSSIVQFIYELNRIRDEKVTENELRLMKNYITGSFARSLESPQTVANFALNTERYNMPRDYYPNYLKKVAAVTVEDVREMAKKYVKPDNAYILVVGKASELSDRLEQFGAVKYYDIYGNNYIPTETSDIPEGVDAHAVINNYIQAIGGKEKIMSVKNLSSNATVSVMGQELSLKEVKATPLNSRTELSMGGMTAQKWVSDGSNASMLQMGQAVPLPDKLKQESIIDNSLFPEVHLEKHNMKVSLSGIEKIDNKDAYVIEMTYPTGGKATMYFDKATGLKVKFSKVLETPQGNLNSTWEYKNYQEVGGIKIPFSLSQTVGPQRLNVVVDEVKINEEVPADTFKVE